MILKWARYAEKIFKNIIYLFIFYINLFKFQPLLFDFTPNIYIAHHYVIYIYIYIYMDPTDIEATALTLKHGRLICNGFPQDFFYKSFF